MNHNQCNLGIPSESQPKAIGSLHLVAASSHFFTPAVCHSRVPWFSSTSRLVLQRHHPGLFLIFQLRQHTVLNAGFACNQLVSCLPLPARQLTVCLFVTSCQPSCILSSMPYLHCGNASKWVSVFQSPISITASLRATAVLAFLPPDRFANRKPQRFREDCPLTVVNRQFAAS